MTTALAYEPIPPIVELLDQELSEERLKALAEGKNLPWRIWENALYGPLKNFLSRPGKEFRARLVATSWQMAGGWGDPPEVLPFLVEILHAGSLVIDDIEDGSLYRRGGRALHHIYGTPLALNAGNWLYFWALSLVEQLDLSLEQRAAVHRAVSECVLRCHYGQGLDLSARLTELPQDDVPQVVATTTRLKSGSLTELAARLGAVAANADDRSIAHLGRFGRELGVGLQMLDDLGSVTSEKRAHKGHEDLLSARPTWPWAWLAEELGELEYARLLALAKEVEARHLHPESLCERLRPRIETIGRRRVRSHLDSAFERLERNVPTSNGLGEVRAEIERLEKSYG